MSRRSLLVLTALLAPPLTGALSSAAGCGDTVHLEEDDDAAGGDGAGGIDDDAVVGGTGGKKDGGKDALPDYVDPGCPDGAGAPIYDFACDPYNQFNGDCLPGDGCFIFVQYPTEPCGPETYGAFCAPPGNGGQGDSCVGGDCQAGFVCVVTGSGTQCVELCDLSGDDGCAAGLVCEPIDVEGFGGCL